MPDILCIVGTDTDAGKTFVASALAKAALDKKKTVLIVKPVQTGCVLTANGEYRAPDIDTYLDAAPNAATCALEMFESACSPHLAAKSAGRTLSAGELAQAVRGKIASHNTDVVLSREPEGFLRRSVKPRR